MRLTVSTSGAGAAALHIQKTLRAKVYNSVMEMNLIAEDILAIALKLAPMRPATGDLRRSGHVSPADYLNEYETHIASVIFGGENAPYAKYHENWHSDSYINETTPGTIPHFIKTAFRDFGGHDEVKRRLRNAVRRV